VIFLFKTHETQSQLPDFRVELNRLHHPFEILMRVLESDSLEIYGFKKSLFRHPFSEGDHGSAGEIALFKPQINDAAG